MINEFLQWLAIAVIGTPVILQVVQDFKKAGEDED